MPLFITCDLFNAQPRRGERVSKKLVLLIEDDPADKNLTLRALRKNNVMNEVVFACDGEEALQYLFGDHEEVPIPSLIILDLKLPKIDGYEVLKQIREHDRTRYVPVAVFSLMQDEGAVERAYRLGANTFVRKPTDPDEFGEAVLNLAMYWLLLNEPYRPGPARRADAS